MSAPAEIVAAGSERSLWDVLELNANSFLGATSQLARMQAVSQNSSVGHEVLAADSIKIIVPPLQQFIQEAANVGAKLAAMHAARLLNAIQTTPTAVTVDGLSKSLVEIESRFADHLISVKLLALNEQESAAFQTGAELVGQDIVVRYPSMVFELEEAAKCLALGRATASAFHSMRAVEVMLGGLRRFLEIPEAEKPADRNWAVVLKAVKEAMDAKYPSKTRKPGSDGAKVEVIYATLDAVKNPWRNATMHVEQTYQPFEASHILQCVNMLAVRMCELCNENGEDVPTLEELLA